MKKKQELIQAIPPEDYSGSIGDWMRELIERGLWNGKKPWWYGDVRIPKDIWWEILEKCEEK